MKTGCERIRALRRAVGLEKGITGADGCRSACCVESTVERALKAAELAPETWSSGVEFRAGKLSAEFWKSLSCILVAAIRSVPTQD